MDFMLLFQRLSVLQMRFSMTASNTNASEVVQTYSNHVKLETFAAQAVSARMVTFERAIPAFFHRNATIVKISPTVILQ
jgi:hypothetical protein